MTTSTATALKKDLTGPTLLEISGNVDQELVQIHGPKVVGDKSFYGFEEVLIVFSSIPSAQDTVVSANSRNTSASLLPELFST